MKSHVLLCAVTVLFANAVNAQTLSRPLRAEVPFEFQAGKSKLPAGEYEIKTIVPGVLHVTNVDNRQAIMLAGNSASRVNNGAPQFIFNKYGDQYFLRQVWDGGPSGVEVGVTPLEKELRAKAAAHQATILARKR